MAKENPQTIYFQQANNDYHGRTMNKHEEMIEYCENTTHRIWLNDLNVGYENHWHSAMEIILTLEDTYEVEVASEKFVLTPGDILIIPPNTLHTILAPESGKRIVYILNISLISMLKSFSGIKSLLIDPLLINNDSYPAIYSEVYSILIQIKKEYLSGNEYSELTIQALLLNMFVAIGNNHNSAKELFPNVKVDKQKEYIQKFNHAIEYIDLHYSDELTLEVLAEYIGFSKYHFSRLFKQYTGYTFCDYLTYRRIKIAEELLAKQDSSITEVALQAGFTSITTFNRIFKQQNNCTPSEYRSKKQYRPGKK